MIPLIDCMFIVLVFFVSSMLAMTIRRGISVELPAAASGSVRRDDATLITITRDGELLLDDRSIRMDELVPALEAREGGGAIVINADAAARHGWFATVLGRVQAAGFTRVTVLTREEQR
jgi:biopolymer transport protein ExbD